MMADVLLYSVGNFIYRGAVIMIYDLQKASLWKRIAAWMFDGILTGILAVGLGVLLSMLLGYDGYSRQVDEADAKYEAQYGIVFEITQDAYEAMDDRTRQNYDAAYEALIADSEAMRAYNMTLNLTLVITSLGILLAMLLWELVIPIWLGNGQTLGKKIFSLCLVRNDGVKLNHLQLFARMLLGKFTIETMLPVYVLILVFWGVVGLPGTLLLFAILIAQVLCLIISRDNCAIHDLIAGTVVVDISSQMIFRTTEDLIAYKKKIAAEQAARQVY